ncbi:unnamed protein product [Meganyctiphanes norvegica]|uniref:Sulfotransferase domain-containing protein n=1 Tax=Meganyctiphanes norvegica TaxID=48144 RepID=A0AAV2QTK0_MEGNR
MKTLSGHTITRYEGEELETFKKEFPCDLQHNGFIRLKPGNWTVPTHFDKFADEIYQFKFRENDTVVCSCPKAGTTWVQEIIWTMKNNPNLDNPDAKLSQGHRLPYFEMDAHIGTEGPLFDALLSEIESSPGEVKEKEGLFLNTINKFPSPRIIKTHLPITLLPPDTLDCTKFVYVARNPYDVCISGYHYCRLHKDCYYAGTFDQFAQRFMEGNIVHYPFWEHVYSAWKMQNHCNLHFIFYEDLKQDPFKEIEKLNEFLETGLTNEQLKNVVKVTSFSDMKNRGVVAFGVVESPEHMNMEQKEKEGGFLRKGIVGDWKDSRYQETIDKMKIWVIDKMKDMEIPFKYEIN